jgi:8-amino-7-oxononanoate synthase
MKTNLSSFQNEIQELASKELQRSMKHVTGKQGREIVINKKAALNFCSNNYLGLADDPRLIQASQESLKSEGFGSGASRLVCGNMDSHRKLEETIAQFKGVERCLFFTSGYMANIGIISALFSREDLIVSDKLNHASIIDGISLSRAESKRYPHKDMVALEDILKSAAGFRRRVIITDSVFSMDGDLAPLNEIVALARTYDALVMVDEAHAFGVFGEHGRGLVEHLGLEGQVDIQMGTLSKAAGAFGAYCCGPSSMIELVLNRARSFIYTTGLPPSVAAAGCAAVKIIQEEPALRLQLLSNAQYLRKGLKDLGFDTMDSETPIIPVVVKDAALCVEFSKRLLDRGIFVQAIRPPTVPVNTCRLRVTVMAKHTQEDLNRLLASMREVGSELAVV